MARQLFWRPDVVWLAAPAFVCAPAALVAARLTGAKAWLHVQDWEIDIAFGMGLVSGSVWRALVQGCECWLLRRFDHVSSISRAMVARAVAKGVAPERTSLVPNWANVRGAWPAGKPTPYRAQLGLPSGAVVALYSGTMGVKQGVDWLAEVALRLEGHPRLHFVLCGEGALQAQTQALCSALPNVHFMPLQPLERLPELLALADVHLLPQRPGTADMVMPSKLTGMLASGRPVVAMATLDSELADVVQACGVVVPHGDVAAFAHAVQYLAERPEMCARLGETARAYAQDHLAADAVLARLEAQLRAVAGARVAEGAAENLAD